MQDPERGTDRRRDRWTCFSLKAAPGICRGRAARTAVLLVLVISTNLLWSGANPSTQAEGRRGMVSSAHPLANKAGLEILKKGGNAFGCRLMAPGTGVWLNNSLAYSTFEPAGNPMDAHPGRRKLSGDCPTIILKDGRPWAALGAPGGHSIGQTVPQIVMYLVDFGMDIGAALAAPRVSFLEPDTLVVEPGIPEAVRTALEAKGHKIRLAGGLSNAHGLTIEYGRDGRPVRLRGASDPRGPDWPKDSKASKPAFTCPSGGEERPSSQPTTGNLPERPPGAIRR